MLIVTPNKMLLEACAIHYEKVENLDDYRIYAECYDGVKVGLITCVDCGEAESIMYDINSKARQFETLRIDEIAKEWGI